MSVLHRLLQYDAQALVKRLNLFGLFQNVTDRTSLFFNEHGSASPNAIFDKAG